MHHTIEDQDIFPRLRRNEGLRPVLDRLQAEHVTIHALSERLQTELRAIALDPAAAAASSLAEIFAVFARTVASHFGYEETQLEEALGVYRIDL